MHNVARVVQEVYRGADCSCTLDGLDFNTHYQIRLRAFRTAGARARDSSSPALDASASASSSTSDAQRTLKRSSEAGAGAMPHADVFGCHSAYSEIVQIKTPESALLCVPIAHV